MHKENSSIKKKNFSFSKLHKNRISLKICQFYYQLKIKKGMSSDDEFPFGNDFDWKKKVFLGQGSYGKVYKVKNFHDGQFYAIKSLKMDEFNQDPTLMASLQGEIAITSQVKSNFTVQMSAFKMGYRYTYMVLQLCDSDLRKELASRKVSQPECVQIFQQIMKGFEVIVKMGYIHRDIKPANVLVKEKIHKVADFGFACKADVFGKKKLTDICGTPIYMAPQLLRNEPYTAKSDIWSLGLMLFEMVFNYTPWPCRSLEQYLNAIYSTPVRFPYNAQIGENTKDFIRRCLVIDQDRRISWKQVFEHPLIKHNQTGQEVPTIDINQYIKKILLKIQNYVHKKSVNILNLMNKYKSEKLNEATFGAMIREIDPTITSHQVSTLFCYLDINKVGWIDWKVIEQKVLYVDFRQQGDVLSRKIDDIVAILKERKQNPNLLFDKIDLNHSGYIDFDEFKKFIAMIAPKYTREEVLNIFGLLDNDRNGLISKEQLAEVILKKMPSPPIHQLASARGLRNIKALAQYMKWSQISPQKLLQMGEEDRKEGLTKLEFQHLMTSKLKFVITPEQVNQVFTIIDKSSNGIITLDQLFTGMYQK